MFLYRLKNLQIAPVWVSVIMDQSSPRKALRQHIEGPTQKTASHKVPCPFISSRETHYDGLLCIPPPGKGEQAIVDHATQTTKLTAGRTESIKGALLNTIDQHAIAAEKYIQIADPIFNAAQRRARDKVAVKNKEINRQKSLFQAAVLFQVILEAQPEKVAQSIEYLTALAQNYSPERKTKLTRNSISQYFAQILKKRTNRTFYDQSTALLNSRLCEIVEELQKSLHLSQMDIKVEVISLLLKTILHFQKYLPLQIPKKTNKWLNKWHINFQIIYVLLKIPQKQLVILKNLFLEDYPKLTYLSNETRIHDLIMTYYLTLLKNKFQNLSLKQVAKFPFEQTKEEFKARKLDAIQRKNSQMKQENKNRMKQKKSTTLSKLFATRQITPRKQASTTELIQTLQAFERIGKNNQTASLKHPQIQTLMNRYKWSGVLIMSRFRSYCLHRCKYMEQENNDLSRLKDSLITKELIRNPNCSYQDVVRLYRSYYLFIERSYFEANVHRLLEKETQYQQLKYLMKVFKWADQHKEKLNVIFIDCSRSNEERGIIVAVNLVGTLTCIDTFETIDFLREAQPLLLGFQRSILFLFDDQFPNFKGLEETSELYWLSKLHILFFLPRVSLVPNPCKVIASRMGETIRERLKDQCSWKSAFEAAIHEFSEANVKSIVQKEWEKAQRLAYPEGGPRRLQEQRNNGQENSYIVIEEGEGEDERGKELSDRLFFPRGHQQGVSMCSPNPQIQVTMENLQARSTDDLRLTLARLLQLNKSPLLKGL